MLLNKVEAEAILTFIPFILQFAASLEEVYIAKTRDS